MILASFLVSTATLCIQWLWEQQCPHDAQSRHQANPAVVGLGLVQWSPKDTVPGSQQTVSFQLGKESKSQSQ